MTRIQLDPKPDDIEAYLKKCKGVVSVNPQNESDGILTTEHVKAQYYGKAYIQEEGLRLVAVERLSNIAYKANMQQIDDHLQAVFNSKFTCKDPFAVDIPVPVSDPSAPASDAKSS